MEATKERVGLLDKILPPNLADAGLEDCALPPESIQEAFRKAADAVKSRAASLLDHEEEGGCVASKGTETTPGSGASDTIILGGENEGNNGPCLAGKGNGIQGGDALVVAGEGGEERSCGDGLKDPDVEGMERRRMRLKKTKKPILVEGFV